MMFNADVNGVDFALPQLPQGFYWHLAVDTSGSAPQDLFTAGEEPAVDNSKPWRLSPRSSAIFLARKRSIMLNIHKILLPVVFTDNSRSFRGSFMSRRPGWRAAFMRR